MKNLFVLLLSLLSVAYAGAQSLTVKKVICTEYHVFYIASDQNVYSFMGGYSKATQFAINGRKAIDGAGAFNVFRVLDDQGYIWSSRQDLTTNTFRFDTDSSGNPFNGNASVYAYENTTTTIKTDGSVWYFGDDTFHLFHTSGGVNMRPMQLSPAGMVFKKLVMGGNRIIGLTTAGDVYVWSFTGSHTPTKMTIPLPALDIFGSHMDYAGCIIPYTSGATSGYPYVWGNNYGCWGGTTPLSQPTSMQSLWKITVPVKVCDANWNTTHYIDTLGRLFGMGYNVQGEVGNGQEFINKYNYSTFPGYGWDFSDGEDPVSSPVQIAPGIKFSQLFSNNWFAFFKYALDVNGNLYSWGRNKAMDLGNGYLDLQEAAHPNSMDVLVPTLVTPLTSMYQTYNWTGPSISAGANQSVVGSTATLTGTATAPQLIAATTPAANGITKVGYNIVSYLWTKVSGGSATITSPGSASTTVTGLSAGTYVFNLLTTDNNTGTQSANVTITVASGSVGSSTVTANAGNPVVVTLPSNNTTLTGTATTTAGTISSYAWTEVSGPNTATITNASSANASVSGLIAGSYSFQLTVVNSSGVKGTSTVTVTVVAASPGTDLAYQTVPDTIQAENYASMSGIGTENTSDAGGGQDVGWIDNGDHISYNLNAATAGAYTVTFRVAVPSSGAAFQVKNSAGAVLATVSPAATGGYQVWESVKANVNLVAGNQSITLTSTGSSGWNINWMLFTAPTPPTGSGPTTSYQAIPGTIQAENYANMSGIQTESTTDSGGGQDVGWIDNGDWFSYNINAATAGAYNVTFRVAAPSTGAQLALKDQSGAILASVNIPATGGYQVWESISATIKLPAGNQTLTIVSTGTSDWNINWLQFVAPSPSTDAAYQTVPGTIQAENYASMSGIATENTSDAGGGQDVGWINNGNWLSYNLNVTQAGSYTVTFRIAVPVSGASFQLKDNTGAVLASGTPPATGGYQTWESVTATVTLPAGNQTLTLVSTAAAGWNINWMQFTANKTSDPSNKAIPGTIQAENYDAIYNATTQTTTDAGGGENVDYITQGSALNYNVSVATAGTYTVGFRVATINSGITYQLRNSAGAVLCTVNLNSTGGWQTWTTQTATVTLPAGNQTLQLYCTTTPYWNLNWISFTNASTTLVNPLAQDGSSSSLEQSASLVPSLALFPNPVNDQFTVDVKNAATGNVTIQLFNLTGQLVRTYAFSKTEQETLFSMSAGDLSAGVYVLHVRIGTWTGSVKMLKIKM